MPNSFARLKPEPEQVTEDIAQKLSVRAGSIQLRKLTFAERLARFDVAKHSGETMVTGAVGVELL
jgi:antitoxin MazE